MTEDESLSWIIENFAVSRETLERLERFVSALLLENRRQNLISVASAACIWRRHIADSAQLLAFAPQRLGLWLDLGSGPGLPGLVIAILRQQPIILVEPRRRRADFMRGQVLKLGLSHARVEHCRIESLARIKADIISARAFAPLPRLFEVAHSFSTKKTLWVLPKGQSARAELESVKDAWQGVFHVKHSVTDANADIIVASRVRRRSAK